MARVYRERSERGWARAGTGGQLAAAWVGDEAADEVVDSATAVVVALEVVDVDGVDVDVLVVVVTAARRAT